MRVIERYYLERNHHAATSRRSRPNASPATTARCSPLTDSRAGFEREIGVWMDAHPELISEAQERWSPLCRPTPGETSRELRNIAVAVEEVEAELGIRYRLLELTLIDRDGQTIVFTVGNASPGPVT